MLPAANRLKLRRDFKRVYQRGRSAACPCFVLYWRKSSGKQPRIGFSVSKKLGKAVRRNAVKRRCRAAAYNLLPQVPHGYDLVFVARTAAANADFARLTAEMSKALSLMRQKLPSGHEAGRARPAKPREV